MKSSDSYRKLLSSFFLSSSIPIQTPLTIPHLPNILSFGKPVIDKSGTKKVVIQFAEHISEAYY